MRTLLDDLPAGRTIVDWMQFLRVVMSKEVIRETRNVGGPEEVIVIDETALAKHKCHCGKPVPARCAEC